MMPNHISNGYIKSIAVFCVSNAIQQLKLIDGTDKHIQQLYEAIIELIKELQKEGENDGWHKRY